MPQSALHIHIHHKRRQGKKKRVVFDFGMYAIALMGPIMALPQLQEVLIKRHVSGVSIVTWGSFAILSIFWIGFAYAHKEKPLLMNATANLIVNSLIVIGIVLYAGR